MRTYTREYTAYATYHGRTPEQQLTHDNGMSEFITWVNNMIVKFKRDHPEAFVGNSIHDHDLKQAYFEGQAVAMRIHSDVQERFYAPTQPHEQQQTPRT